MTLHFPAAAIRSFNAFNTSLLSPHHAICINTPALDARLFSRQSRPRHGQSVDCHHEWRRRCTRPLASPAGAAGHLRSRLEQRHAPPRLRNLTRRPIAAQGPSLAISPARASTASRLRIGSRTTDRVQKNPSRCRKQGASGRARRLNPLIGTTTIGRRRSRTFPPHTHLLARARAPNGERHAGPSAGAARRRALLPRAVPGGASPQRCLSRRGHPAPARRRPPPRVGFDARRRRPSRRRAGDRARGFCGWPRAACDAGGASARNISRTGAVR